MVGCDFCTGRTGNGWMVTARGGSAGDGVAEVAGARMLSWVAATWSRAEQDDAREPNGDSVLRSPTDGEVHHGPPRQCSMR